MERKDTNTSPITEPIRRNIVCLYSQVDGSFYLQLKKSLSLLERQGQVHWLEIGPGAERALTWQRDVQHADLILFLLSSDFFVDELCYQSMHLAIEERTSRQVPVVPILVRAVNWRLSACKDLAIVPHNEQPVASWSLPDEAYASIGADLARLVPGWPPIPSPTRPRLFQARDLPKGYVARPKAFAQIKHLLLNHQVNQTTALSGAGGFGKTTLALALCHDLEIQAAFSDGILWIELGEQPARPLDILNRVLYALEPALPGAITLEEARDHWRLVLEKHTCLLVIDDVWQAVALEELLKGGPRCGRLITTRNDQVLPEDTKRVWVDVMETEEAMALLCHGWTEGWQHMPERSVVERVVRQLGCWSLLLSLARDMLINQVMRLKKTPVQALSLIEQAYEHRGVTAFHLGDRIERQRTAAACLEVSLRQLEEWAPPRYQPRQRYQELAVFPEDTDIPLTTLQTYWQGTGGLQAWETEELCLCLSDLSLLLPWNSEQGTVRLHDVMRSYLIQNAGPHLLTLHGCLLDAYQQKHSLTRWANLPRSEAYLWQHLIFHLQQSGRQKTLQTTLTDLGYLTRKALYVGVSALEADCLFSSTISPTGTAEPVSSFFASLHRNIVHVSHLLRQVQTEAEIGGLLLGHLGGEATFATQLFALEQDLPRPFLTAWHPLPGGSSAVLLRTLHGHNSQVTSCAVSPDGTFIVSASTDETLKMWNTTTGAERLSFKGHTGQITSCAVSSDDSFIVSASTDKTLKVWNTTTGAEWLSLKGHTGQVTSCAVSPDGSFIVSASTDKTLKIWDAVTGAERLTLAGHTSAVSGCAVSPDNCFIVSASWDTTLKVWDAATGAECLALSGHTHWVSSCAVSPDNRFIISASDDKTLKVWNMATGAERLTLAGHTDAVSGCAVSPDSSFIVSTSLDKTLKVWDMITGAERLSFKGHTNWVTGCAVSPDGNWIVSASRDNTLKIWNTTMEAERPSFTGHASVVPRCAVSPDGTFIVSASNNDLQIWNAATGARYLSLKGHIGSVTSCAVSPNGQWIVSASNDRTLKIWDATTGAQRLSLIGHTGSVYDCAVSSNGQWIVSASWDTTLKVWNADTGVEHLSLRGHIGSVTSCAMSHDGSFIISASWDNMLKMWDMATGAQRLSLSGHTSYITSCAVSPNGHWIISASDDKTLKVWNTLTEAERFSLKGHTASVTGCAVSPDGSFIASTSSDHTLKLWDMQTGRCLLTFPVDGELSCCAFHPDGEHLVACGAQGVYFLRLVV